MRQWLALFCLIWISDMTAVWTQDDNCPQETDAEVEESKDLTGDTTYVYPALCYSDDCTGGHDGH